jgi:hypothetical protein
MDGSLWLGVVALVGAGLLAACNPAGQNPSPPPTSTGELPALEVPTSSVISTTGACLDPATSGILNQLQGQGADSATILATHKDALIQGLQAFQPQDAATATWRDQLVAALQAGDLVKAAAEVRMLGNAEVAVASC